MTNLILALIYKIYGFSYGKLIRIGDGEPSSAALSTFGFPWPEGSVLKYTDPMGETHTWKVEINQVKQLDT